MKLCTFSHPSGDQEQPLLGLVHEDRVVSVRDEAAELLGTAPVWANSMQQMLDAGAVARETLVQLDSVMPNQPGHSMPIADVQFHAPLARPRSLRDCLSFEQHWIQCAQTIAKSKFAPVAWLDQALYRTTGRSLLRPPPIWRKRPIYYKGNPASVVGDGETIHWPRYSDRLDFELEIAVYVSKSGVDIPINEAADYVAGLSLFNDFSARDVQFREMRARLGPSKSKDFDTGNALGPWVVTLDEVDLDSQNFQVWINDQLWAETTAQSLRHSIAETVSFLSQSETLHAGDVIGLGTLPNGCGLEMDRWIQDGDTVRIEGGPLGRLTNTVKKPSLA